MKTLKKIPIFFLILMMCMNILSIPVYATSISQDGVEVVLTTDKESYSQDEQIVTNLAVTNTNDIAVTNVSVEILTPEGYQLAVGSEAAKEIKSLEAGESVSLRTTYNANIDTNKDTVNNNLHQNTSDKNQNASNVKTGDDNNIILWIGMLILGVAGITVVVILKKKKGKRFLSILLCFAMMGTTTLGLCQPVQATEEKQSKKIEIDSAVYVGNDSVNLKAIVCFQISVNTATQNTYTVSFESNGENVYNMPESQIIAEGECAVYPGIPTSEGYIFAGWYLDKDEKDLANQYDFSQIISKDITLYAKWIDADLDSDKDGIPDELESYFGSDPTKLDTDGDGLTDYEESVILGTNPAKQDSDDNGISDFDEDTDGDGLSNGDEIEIESNPIAIDSDLDGLTDYEEVTGTVYKTNPLSEDTDSDGANDFWEINNGFDPTVFNENFTTTVVAETPNIAATVTAALPGDKAVSLAVTPMENHPLLSSGMPGYIGEPFEFSVASNLENTTATISFSFDTSLISEKDFDPTIYYWDEENQYLQELPTSVQGNVASTQVTHFSTYILLNKTEFDTVWENEIKPPLSDGEDSEEATLDIMFVIDYSNSMNDNDPNQLFKQLSKEFIEKLRDGKDKSGVVKFIRRATLVSGLTLDKMTLSNAIDGISYDDGYGSNSGTDGSAGIKMALDELATSASKYQYIVFITDGEDNGYSYSYDTLIKEATESAVTIYAIGMGSANETILKQISDATGGKYYHATTDTTAEDLINLDDVFSDIESETVDLTTDTDNDKIPDYYEQRLCTGSGVPFNLDITNPDCDNDGLLDGEEIVIETSNDGHVYGKVISDPWKYFTDTDIYGDYDEVKQYHSDPALNNVSFLESDTSFLIENENFVSDKYLDFYENNWYGWLERASVWLGNNVFGSNYDTTYLYKTILMEYLEQMVDESEEANEIREIIGFSHKLLSQMNTNIGTAIEISSEGNKEVLQNLRQQLNNYSKNLNEIANADLIDAGYTKEQIYKLWDDSMSDYQEVSEQIPELNAKIEFNTKIGKASKVIGVFFDVADVALTGYDFYKEYSTFAASISSMESCLETLEKIQNSSEAPSELKNAANELYKVIEEQKVNNLDTFFDGLTTVGGKIGSVAVVTIPVVGKYIAAAKLVLGIGDFVFNVSDVSKQCACLYAISKASSILSTDFSDSLSNGEEYGGWKNIYGQYGSASYNYFSLAIMRKTSERQMKTANEANSFLIEWLFTEIMYQTDVIDANIEKIDLIKYNYVAAGAI